MPNIREYTFKGSLKPDERGIQAINRTASAVGSQAQSAEGLGEAQARGAAAEGAGLASFGRSIGGAIADTGKAYVNWQTNREISHGAAQLAEVQNALTTQWTQTAKTADPNDPTTGAQFHEKMLQPVMDKFRQGFTTEESQRWADMQLASLSQHFNEKTSADMASLAGDAAVQNVNVMQSRASNTVLQDPTALNATLGMVDASITAMVDANPNLSAQAAAKLKGDLTRATKVEITKSAVWGMIEKNPEAAKVALATSKFGEYLDGTDVETLSRAADTMIRLHQEEARTATAEQVRQNKAAVAVAANKLTSSLVQPDGSLALPKDYFMNVARVAAMPDAPEGLAESLINFGVSKNRELATPLPIHTDPLTYATFAERVLLDPSDPNALSTKDILDARTAHRLDDTDFQHFVNAVNSPKEEKAAVKEFNKFLTSLKGYMTSSSFLKVDAYGDQRFYEFSRDADATRMQMKAAGKTDEEIQATILKSMPRYQLSPDVMQHGIQSQARGGLKPLPDVKDVPARAPGETPAAYLARTGKK